MRRLGARQVGLLGKFGHIRLGICRRKNLCFAPKPARKRAPTAPDHGCQIDHLAPPRATEPRRHKLRHLVGHAPDGFHLCPPCVGRRMANTPPAWQARADTLLCAKGEQMRQDHLIPTAQGRIFARDWNGDANRPPLILLHDSLGCVELWRDFPDQLAQATGRRMIAYDRLGFGRSDPRADQLDPLNFITSEATGDFTALLHALNINDFTVLGHSVGGGMGLGIAAHYPDRCKALVTISAQTFAEAQTLNDIRAAKAGFAAPEQMQRLARWHGEKAEWVLAAWTESWLAPQFAAWSLDRTLSQVACPVLVLHGEQDEYGSPAHPARIADLAPGPVTLRILANEGHFPHRTNPGAVITQVVRFLG